METADKLGADKNHNRAHDDGAEDSPEQNAVLVSGRNVEG